MRFKGFYLFTFAFFIHSICFSQIDNLDSSRSAIFDRLEARAKSLASRMDEIMVSSDSTDQTIFNEGTPPQPPSVSLAREEKVSIEEPSISSTSDSLAEPFVPPHESFKADDNSEDFLPPPTVQELKGDYYIVPTLGLALSSRSTVSYVLNSIPESKDLDNELGFSLGVRGGMRFGNFYSDIGIKYTSLDFNIYGATIGNSFPYIGDGILDLLKFDARLGYTFQINDSLAFNSSVGFGLANRKNTIDIHTTQSNFYIGSITSNESVLSYDLTFSLSYDLANNFMATLGYNYVNVAKISQFSALNMHIFELGVGANF